jgi:hypothetical protein
METDNDAGPGAGTCVECTGTEYQACAGDAGTGHVCDCLKKVCSDKTEHSAGLCKPCVSDAECPLGELCVEQRFNGRSVGFFCFYKQGDTVNGAPADCTLTGRPYSGVLKNALSIDGQLADICSLVTSTCTALNQFRQTNCSSATGSADDLLCGSAPGVDSKCAAYGPSQHLCTVTCLSDLDCKTGVTCNTGVIPNICTFQ